MKTYEILIEGNTYYFKTDASTETIEQAIAFVKNGEVTLEKVLVAIRMLGNKAQPLTIKVEDIFEV